MAITKRQKEILQPLLEGNEPGDDGEWNMHCPYHGDSKRSASLNAIKGLWNCKTCGEAGKVSALVKDSENWNIDEEALKATAGKSKRRGAKEPMPTEAMIKGWVSALKSETGALNQFMQRRGLTKKIIFDHEIGWRSDRMCYTIPIRNADGDILNVRYYQLNPRDVTRKIWSVAGHGAPELYPIEQLENDALVLCEGELDALSCIQRGIPAITRTGTADSWDMQWNTLFQGKRIFVCHDMDTKGQHANEKMANALRGEAASVTIVQLPYPVEAKHGKDLTDFFNDGYNREGFLELIRQGRKTKGKRQNRNAEEAGPAEQVHVSVMDSFDASLVHKPIAMNVTITGKRTPSFLLPATVTYTCDRSMKDKCVDCVLGISKGNMVKTIDPSDPEILSMVNAKEADLAQSIFKTSGIKKCIKPQAEITSYRTVEEIYVRPSIEESSADPDFTHRKIISVGSHDLQSNQTVRFTGTIRPNPLNQTNEFQAWQVERPPSTMDNFKVTPETMELMQQFQSDTSSPLERCYEIAADLSQGVTLIRGRDNLHVFMDLVLHSALEFRFGAEAKGKGWLDGLVIGDTRTGKSEIASKLIIHYGMGELISCESATFAGVVGGLDRIGDGKWIVKWGSIPINDRRAVVLDELTGLQPEQIAQMSSIRSSGVAELTKIQSERANARTRLICLTNPRDSDMGSFTYGVQAIQPVIGNPEDIARFDLAMGVFSSEVPSELINVNFEENPYSMIPQQAYRNLLMWAWTRKAEHIRWGNTAVKAVLKAATKMGGMYRQDPPLVQGANVRLKIARVAVAMAIRTFNTDLIGERVIVTPDHVAGAVDFMNDIYGNPLFGYRATSVARKADEKKTVKNMDEIISYIGSVREGGFIRFIKEYPRFNRGQIEMSMNMSREESQQTFSRLWELGAIGWSGKEWVSLEAAVLERVRNLK